MPITKVSATELFNDALPKILSAYKDKGMKVTGTFDVNIFGQGGGHSAAHAAALSPEQSFRLEPSPALGTHNRTNTVQLWSTSSETAAAMSGFAGHAAGF